jgi:hypothetical protein
MTNRYLIALIAAAAGAAASPLVIGRVAESAQTAPQAYTSPRTPYGQPDLQGVWQALNSAAWDIQDHAARLDVPAGQGVVEGNEIPYKAEALAKKQENLKNAATADPLAKCYLPGVPRITYLGYPFQIHQFEKYVVILYEFAHAWRIIYLDGSKHPFGHIDWWLGDSRGRWEGDTLVVDVVHFNDQTWFDRAGNYHSDALHVVERYTRTGPNHLRYEATIEDPKVFTRPWKMSMPIYRRMEPNAQVLEYECYAYLGDEKYPTSPIPR